MKSHVTAIVAALGLVALASAQATERQHLAQVNVSSSTLDCTPPNSSAACSAWHEEIRRSFSSREIGMLFGAATSYPEYRTSYATVKARYDRLQDEFAANLASADAVASK
jgi:hypothetical protein